LAAQILALSDEALARRIDDYRSRQTASVPDSVEDASLQNDSLQNDSLQNDSGG